MSIQSPYHVVLCYAATLESCGFVAQRLSGCILSTIWGLPKLRTPPIVSMSLVLSAGGAAGGPCRIRAAAYAESLPSAHFYKSISANFAAATTSGAAATVATFSVLAYHVCASAVLLAGIACVLQAPACQLQHCVQACMKSLAHPRCQLCVDLLCAMALLSPLYPAVLTPCLPGLHPSPVTSR
jgi:hypothetical protein